MILSNKRADGGFTLTEMLVTMFIVVMASTLLATGVPAAIEAYKKTVSSANAQVALSTTTSALRAELGLATNVRIQDGAIYYVGDEGCWVKIANSEPNDFGKGLTKTYCKGDFTETSAPEDEEGATYDLIPKASVTSELHVAFELPTNQGASNALSLKKVSVCDRGGHELASVGDTDYQYRILTRFVRS